MSPKSSSERAASFGLWITPVVFVAVLLAPTSLPAPAHRLAAVFAAVVILWVTEAIPLAMTALLGPAVAVVLGVEDATEVFASFGHPVLFLFLGSFMIARAMSLHGLDRRIALFVLSRPVVGDRPDRILFAFGAIAMLLSMWLSNTATTAMMLPIGMGVLSALPVERQGATAGWATGLMLMIAYATAVGGVATPIGTPPNLIAIGMIEQLAGRRISFFEWMRFAVPISLAMFGALYLIVRAMYPAPTESFAGASRAIREQRAQLGPWSAGERATLAAFCLAVALWTLPGIATALLGADDPRSVALGKVLPEAVGAILAAGLLFVIPVDRSEHKFALGWSEAVRIDWGTVLLFGGGLALGTLAFSTGLAKELGGGALAAAGELPRWAYVLAAVLIGVVLTEFMSNTAIASLLVPMFLAVGGAGAGDPVLAAIAATLGCSLAFCLPVSTPPNAIVYGSGYVPLAAMIRTGVGLDLVCSLITWAALMLLVS